MRVKVGAGRTRGENRGGGSFGKRRGGIVRAPGDREEVKWESKFRIKSFGRISVRTFVSWC